MKHAGVVLSRLMREGRKGLIVYLTAGYPDFSSTLTAVQAAEQAGADVIELGIPFSDPMADGPVIQRASAAALKAGATTAKVLDLVAKIRSTSAIPLVIMTYVNIVLQFGAEKFLTTFAAAGASGLAVPDLPLEESALLENTSSADIDLIRFIAPTTGKERLGMICHKAGGFLYCISTTGVTGTSQIDFGGLALICRETRQISDLPLAVGFGISNPATACQAARYADAVIIGSAVMQQIMEQGPDSIGQLIRPIRQALNQI